MIRVAGLVTVVVNIKLKQMDFEIREWMGWKKMNGVRERIADRWCRNAEWCGTQWQIGGRNVQIMARDGQKQHT